MNVNDPQVIIIGAAVLLAVIGIVFLVARARRKAQSEHLQKRFGPEYSRVVNTVGDREKAEAELAAREARVERLKLVPLSPTDATRFAQEWTALQSSFVDNPTATAGEADRLVRELMTKRGYPMGDFERRAADISVHHPAVVENYRAGQAIAARASRGEASTEELRKAVVHYRALFDELLEAGAVAKGPPSAEAIRREKVVAHS